MMKTFKVSLTRTYNITVEAEDEKSALEAVEFFIGDPEDKSIKKEQEKYHFKINEIEMILNEAFEAEEIYE
jgi:hypothetical protein